MRTDDREHNAQQVDYEADVTARLEAMAAADYEAAEVLNALESIPSEGLKDVKPAHTIDYDALPHDEFDFGQPAT
ncbi:hypothetical protein V493_02058 [Pseudogymnoascus sp. VKM F-4281 (FW-2241)]|nr:hypothetical protein V493_02058 [Pseudogymnoascus sp. VKM F-4281 (FW-2241)]